MVVDLCPPPPLRFTLSVTEHRSARATSLATLAGGVTVRDSEPPSADVTLRPFG